MESTKHIQLKGHLEFPTNSYYLVNMVERIIAKPKAGAKAYRTFDKLLGPDVGLTRELPQEQGGGTISVRRIPHKEAMLKITKDTNGVAIAREVWLKGR